MNLKPVVHAILKEYTLPWHGMHGISHWARVMENGLRIAEETMPTSKWSNCLPFSMILDVSMKASMMDTASEGQT
jgi:hypothetical protein